MKINITTRLFLLILVAIFLSTVSLMTFMRWNLDRSFLRHLNNVAQATVSTLRDNLETYYQREGSWDQLKEEGTIWNDLLLHSVNNKQPAGEDQNYPDLSRFEGSEIRPIEFDILKQHFVLLDQDKDFIVGRRDMKIADEFFPVAYEGRVVGYIGFVPTKDLLSIKQRRFLKDLHSSLLTLVCIIILLSALIALFLARKMVRPIKQLAAATHRLTAGDLSTRVEVRSRDEIGSLADDFNHLAFTLEKNEQARQQWMAEISHELRTPVAILRGEIEALQDGIRPLNQTALASLHSESIHLGRLADDLYHLAMSDVGTLTYKKSSFDLISLLGDVCNSFEDRFLEQGIELTVDYGMHPLQPFFGDESRLRQLCDNLLDNALKYTDQGGQVRITISAQKTLAVFEIQDSAPAVARDELEKLLDRFYRSPHNQKNSDGVGLGLSICRNIVEGHQGQISLYQSPLGGLGVRVELPIRELLS